MLLRKVRKIVRKCDGLAGKVLRADDARAAAELFASRR